MPTDPRYTKANVTPAAARVLKIIAAEQNKYIYEVVDDLIKEKYPGYFRKIGCRETKKLRKNQMEKGETENQGLAPISPEALESIVESVKFSQTTQTPQCLHCFSRI